MKKFPKKNSRLIFIYILTVAVSGSILTWLSLNNISNFEELTEKRITEEEKFIIENYSLAFQESLYTLISRLENMFSPDSFLTTGKILGERDLIRNGLLMNSDGAMIRPRFVHEISARQKTKSSSSFLKTIKKAEDSEFIEQNYAKAKSEYQYAFKFSNTNSDSARILNAIARLYIKNNEPQRAFEIYARILNDFSNANNETGFPYAYFSINQLINLKENFKLLPEDIFLSFLKKVLNNQNPVNSYTKSIINEIQKMAIPETNTKNQEIQSLCHTVNELIDLVQDYEIPMNKIVLNQNDEHQEMINDFFVIIPENNDDEMMLVQKKDKYCAGFIVDLFTLDSIAQTLMVQNRTIFDYNLSLVDAINGNNPIQKELKEQSSFSPFFKNKAILVSLMDTAAFEDYILRRKLITIIGLVLLLGAMLIGLYTLIKDVERKRKMEKLRSDFVSNVTHELKTPLTSINMFADSIVLGTVKNEQKVKKYANVIVKESERLKRMINNILDFSRKENNRLKYNVKSCEISGIIEEILDEMNYWLEINHFEVERDWQKGIMALVDPEGLKQVLSNLISNAIKYSPKNRKLLIRLFKSEKKIIVEVRDFGIGIPKEKQTKIFEKFYRVQTTENETISGTGLGLTVSRDIIQAMGGEILVKSEPGEGSTFTIELNS